MLLCFLICRHIYVADLLDHNVHVLEQKEDNTLVSVKVNISDSQQYYHTQYTHCTLYAITAYCKTVCMEQFSYSLVLVMKHFVLIIVCNTSLCSCQLFMYSVIGMILI